MNICFSQKNIQSNKIYSAKDLQNKIKLKTGWKAKVTSDSLVKNVLFNDESWNKQSPLFLKIKDSLFTGELWFRKTIQIDSTLVNTPISISLSSKGNAFVYLNGNYVGEYKKTSDLNNETNYPIIFTFKNAGNNVLAVHYKDLQHKQKTFLNTQGFNMSLMTVKMYEEEMRLNNYLWLAATAIGYIFITLGVIHLILFGFYRKFIANLFFGLFNLCSGLSHLLGYAPMLKNGGISGLTFIDLAGKDSILFSLIGSLAISATVNFLFSKNKKRFYIITILVAISIVLAFFVSPNFIYLCSALTTLLFIEAIIVVIIATFNKKPGAKIIAFGIILSFAFAMVLGMFVGMLVSIQKMNVLLMTILIILIVLSFFTIPFSMSAFLASNFAAVSRKLKVQLKQVNQLSEQSLNQEKERKELLENKMNFLEKEVKERTKEIEIQKQQIQNQQTELLSEKQKSEDLLLNILPKDVAEELKENGESKVKQFSSVSILFSDFTNLHSVSKQLNSQELLDELNYCFQAFDHITTKHQIEKIKTIGYSYMAVSGLPLENENHAKKMIEVSFEMCQFITDYQTERKNENKPYFEIKIGINSGEVVAGIVGIKKFAYDIWGDAVNTAARMKAKSENGKINVGHSTYELAKNFFDFNYRGELEIKGKGLAKMYFVETKTI